MKLKLILILIASCISNIQAAPFTFADITNPAKKACADAACVLGNHSGKLALTGFALGSVMYTLADREYSEVGRKAKKLEELRATVLNPESHLREADYQDRSEQLKKAIAEYTEAQSKLSKIKTDASGSAELLAEFKESVHKTVPKDFRKELERAKREAEEAAKKVEIRREQAAKEIKEAEARLKESETTLSNSFDLEIKNLNIQALQNHYNTMRNFGLFIALASAAGYGTYKAYPYLRKWFAAYYNK